MIKIQIGDRDPWHLSPRPLAFLIAGLLLFCIGAAAVTVGGSGWWWLAVVAGATLFSAGLAAALREKRDMDAAIEAAENDTAGQM